MTLSLLSLLLLLSTSTLCATSFSNAKGSGRITLPSNWDYFTDEFVPLSSGQSKSRTTRNKFAGLTSPNNNPHVNPYGPYGDITLHTTDQEAHLAQTSLKDVELDRPDARALNIPRVKAFVPSTPKKPKRDTSSSSSPEQIAREALAERLEMYGLKESDASQVVLDHVHDTGFGPIIVKFKQAVDGVVVYGHRLSVTLSRRDMTAVSFNGFVVPSSSTEKGLGQFPLPPLEGAKTAMMSLLQVKVKDEQMTLVKEEGERFMEVKVSGVERIRKSIRMERVGYFTGREVLPSYYVEIYITHEDGGRATEWSQHLYSLVVSAMDGEVMNRKSLTHRAQTYGYEVWADSSYPYQPYDGPQGKEYNPYPSSSPSSSSSGSVPLTYVNRKLVELSHGPISTKDAWLSDDATTTIGNNAFVAARLYFPGEEAVIPLFTNRSLKCIYDPSADGLKRDHWCAAITEVFFVLNWLHDWFYDAGFDEMAGNAQDNNYNRQGWEGDKIIAYVHNSTAANNMNTESVSVPADGSSPVMYFNLWKGEDVGRVQITSPVNMTVKVMTSVWGSTDFDGQRVQLQMVNDGVGVMTDGCSEIQEGVRGKMAVMDQVGCEMSVKTQNAAQAGAVGVMILTDVFDDKQGWKFLVDRVTEDIVILGVGVNESQTIRNMLQQQATTTTATPVEASVYRRLRRYDSAVDNTLIAHEWAHVLVSRLVYIHSAQSRALAEGWADFVALMMIVREEDIDVEWNGNWTGTYGLFSYVTQGTNGQSSYRGGRRAPYSTDMNKNPLTFGHISNNKELPTWMTRGIYTDDHSEMHNAGEIWAVALWECYASLLRDTIGNNARLTFQAAQDRMKSYLVASMKTTKQDPTFLDARDALLNVALANDIADHLLFWKAFAKRGMGMSAVAPAQTSEDFSSVVEDFYAGAKMIATYYSIADDVKSCDHDGWLDRGEIGRLNVTVQNNAYFNLTSPVTLHVECDDPYLIFLDNNTRQLDYFVGNQITKFSFLIQYNNTALNYSTTTLHFRWRSNLNNIITQETYGSPIYFNWDRGENVSTFNQVDTLKDYMTAYGTYQYSEYDLYNNRTPPSPGAWIKILGAASQYFWHINDMDYTSDFSLETPDFYVSSAPHNTFSFHFWHAYDWESEIDDTAYDGSVVELYRYSTKRWVDIMKYSSAFKSLKNITEASSYSNNSLAKRLAYTGRSPSLDASLLDYEVFKLGNFLNGQKVKIRFRAGTDQSGSTGYGWYINQIGVSGIDNTPFPGYLASKCIFPDENTSPPISSASSIFFPFITILVLLLHLCFFFQLTD